MNFFDWFETCPFWQALGLGATLFSLLMAVTGLALRASERNRHERSLRAFVEMRGPAVEA